MRRQFSSNSDSEDQNFDGHYKQVKYQGQLSYSEQLESDMQESNFNYERSNVKYQQKERNNSFSVLQKSKAIKKNCESAKASRQRKKLYLEVLQHTALQLKDQINSRKVKIQSVFDEIISKFHLMNREKQKYLIQKILMSKKIIKLTQDLEQLKSLSNKKEQIKIQAESHEIQKNISPQTLSIQRINSSSGQKNPKNKIKKKKGAQLNTENQSCINSEDKIQEREGILDLGINAYLYQFGSQGCNRTQVRQRSKYEWITCLSNTKCTETQQLQEAIEKMKRNLQALQKKIKKIDYYIKQLQKHVKQKSVVEFLLDRQFFAFRKKNQRIIEEELNEQ